MGALLHAKEQTFFNAMASPRLSETQKSENHVLCWDSKGVLYVDFLTERRTINAEYYSALLEGPVKAAIRNKRERAQTSVSFLQDNAHPHVAARTMETIQELK